MQRHLDNSMALAKYFQTRKEVKEVIYPGLENHPTHELAKKYLKNGFGAMITLELEGGEEAGKRFVESLELVSHLANIGDAKTLAIVPSLTTHQQLSADDQLKAGVKPATVRVSVGIEHVEDLKADFSQALEKSQLLEPVTA